MTRILVAILAGITFFLAYMALAVSGYDWVAAAAWPAQALYFLVAGLLWVLPVRALMLWAARPRLRRLAEEAQMRRSPGGAAG